MHHSPHVSFGPFRNPTPQAHAPSTPGRSSIRHPTTTSDESRIPGSYVQTPDQRSQKLYPGSLSVTPAPQKTNWNRRTARDSILAARTDPSPSEDLHNLTRSFSQTTITPSVHATPIHRTRRITNSFQDTPDVYDSSVLEARDFHQQLAFRRSEPTIMNVQDEQEVEEYSQTGAHSSYHDDG